MSEINGIYAASVSILDKNLKLDIDKTIKHAENLIEQGFDYTVLKGTLIERQEMIIETLQTKLLR